MRKLNKKRVIIFLLIILAVLIGISTIFFNMRDNKNNQTISIEKDIKEYGYTLNSNEINEYKSEFKNLENILKENEINEEEYVKSISKLFILDFYNLENKLTSNDIGGEQFVHTSAIDNFKLKANDTIYHYIESNIYGNRKQKLPKVSSVEIINIKKVTFKYGKEEDNDAYEIQVKWNYVEDLGYQKEKTLVFIHEGKKLSLVEMK